VTINPGEEFRIKATPSPELARKLVYLAAQDNDSVLTGLKSTSSGPRSADETKRRADAQFVRLFAIQQQQMQILTVRLEALDQASEKALRQAQEDLESIRSTANRAKDGRLVFEDTNGKIYDEQGQEVSKDAIDRQTWNPAAGKWEDYQDAKQRIEEAQAYQQRIQEQRERLGENPDAEDLKDIDRELDALESQMPASVAREYQPPKPRQPAEGQEASLTRPTSAAKAYLGEPALQENTILRLPFAGAVTIATAKPDDKPDAASTPGAPFAPT